MQGACLIRVPTENVKQNLQAGRYQTQSEAVQTILRVEGVGGFYKGFLSTVFREVCVCSGHVAAKPGLWLTGFMSAGCVRVLLLLFTCPYTNTNTRRSPSPSSSFPSTRP